MEACERRIKERFEAPDLSVQLCERRFLGKGREPVNTTCLDINRYGTALLCPRPVSPGTRLFLDFSAPYIRENRVSAKVVDCYPFQTGYRLGIAFTYCRSNRVYSRTVDNALSRIEGFYNRLAG